MKESLNMENLMSKNKHKYISGLKPLLILLFINLLGFYPSLSGNHTYTNSLREFKEHQKPYYFLENKGQIIDQYNQTNKSVLYQLALPGMNVSLKSNGFSYDTWQAEELGEDSTLMTTYHDKHNPVPHNYNYKFHRVDIDFINANTSCKIEASGKAPDYNMYYTTGTPEEGAKVYQYERVVYKNLYDGIDLEFVAKPGTNKPVEYNFIVHPGADVSQIKMRYSGALANDLVNGNLELKIAHTNLIESIPSSWIKETGKAVEVNYSKIVKDKNSIVIGFESEKVNVNSTLIIDPIPNLDWSTYYGGSSGDNGNDIITDNSGNVFIVGGTYSINSIATTGAHQTSLSSSYDDVFIVKFNTNGVRQWGTYYGGSSFDAGSGIATDNSGNVFLSGYTGSITGIATNVAHQSSLSGSGDAFIVKFNTNGVRQWGTYYGGSGNDFGNDIVIDNSGNLLVSGSTNNSTTGIATTGAHQTTYGGGVYDAFIVKFNTNGVRQWGTYYGGSDTDEGQGIAIDNGGNIFIVGYTLSINNIATTGAHQTSLDSISDAFIVKFNTSGVRQWGTYYGGSGGEFGSGIAIDNSGNLFVSGSTNTSTTGIATPGAHQTTYGGGVYDAFIAKFNTSGVRQWGTYYGGSGADLVNFGIATDNSGNVFVSGRTVSISDIATTGAHQTIYGGGIFDAFIVKFNTNGVRQWGTYYGGSDFDSGYGIGTDLIGNIFIIGITKSTSGIATPGAHQSFFGGGTYLDTFIAYFNECNVFNFTNQPLSQNVNINSTIQFNVSSTNISASYQWQTDVGFGFQNLTNAGQYSGVNNDTLTVSNITLGNNNQIFRCIVSNGSCSDTSNTAVLTVITTGINDVTSNGSFWVQPNPVTDILQLNTTASNLNVVYSIIDLTGRVISTGNISSESTQIHMRQFVSGIYLLRINDGKEYFKIMKD